MNETSEHLLCLSVSSECELSAGSPHRLTPHQEACAVAAAASLIQRHFTETQEKSIRLRVETAESVPSRKYFSESFSYGIFENFPPGCEVS